MMINPICDKKNFLLQYLTALALAAFFIYAVYFMAYSRPLYRDYYGNYAGSVILIGLICIFFLFEYIKAKSVKLYCFAKYYYVLICIWGMIMTLNYKSKLCFIAELMFLFLQVFLPAIIRLIKICNLKFFFNAINVILSISSIIVHYFVNINHEGLFSLAIHVNIFIFIVAVIIINYVGIVIVSTMCDKQRGYSIYSAYIVLLFCLSFDTAIIKSMLCVFFIILLIMELLPYDEHETQKIEVKSFSYKKRIVKGMICSFTIFLPYFILGPIEIYAGNQTELLFSYYHFFFPFLITSIVLSVAIALFIAILKHFDMICASMTIFGFVSWFQAMFLNKILFDVNGHAIEWGKYDELKEQNAYIWIILIVLLHLIYSVIYLKTDNKNPELYLAIPIIFEASGIMVEA